MDNRLLELLVCPLCKGPLDYFRPPKHVTHELICHHDKLAFAIRDQIPLLLVSQARDLQSQDETLTSFVMQL